MKQDSFRIMNIIGARPNMMKVAPLLAEMKRHTEIEPVLVHTGQHYDYAMSQVFLDQLHMPEPDYNLEVGSGTHHKQTAEIIRSFGELVAKDRPDMVLVVGDVNSTIACALVAAKENIPVVHVEAGLRSFDRSMPEEINRILTDSISDLLFTTEESGNVNLAQEGVPSEKVHFVGNLMIDSLMGALHLARESALRKELALTRGEYAVLTLHRPSNVDDKTQLTRTLAAILKIAERIPILFPSHPRTAARIEQAGIRSVKTWAGGPISDNGLWMMPPASYLDFIGLVDQAAFVLTDSGGIQEEATFLAIPCLTYRNNTERPVTVTMGTNKLIGSDPDRLLQEASVLLDSTGAYKNGHAPVCPPLWDGRTAARIVDVLKGYLWGRRKTEERAIAVS
ncbi:MAG TPA: UDP-N-acetylglucosamine 2-epimerase (non-hydrolyzing) [Terracidiphilus sp.]|nr:UDP-N-acetylglucosamine 2-epimerase (non-hydrolyzing) [Terracidiphilus sp.]